MNKIGLVCLNYNNYQEVFNFFKRNQEALNLVDKIVVVDNQSTDNSLNHLLELKNDKIQVISSPINGGYASGNNFGINYLKEVMPTLKYVIVANPDVEFKSDLVKNAIKVLEDNQASLVSSISYDLEGKLIKNFAWEIPTYKYYLFNTLGVKRKNQYLKQLENNNQGFYVECIPGCLLFINYDDFKSVGMFDEKTFLYVEESILGYKLKAINKKTFLLTNCSYNHLHLNHQSKQAKINHYKYLTESRRYYIKEILKKSKFKLFIYDLMVFKSKILLRIKLLFNKKKVEK